MIARLRAYAVDALIAYGTYIIISIIRKGTRP